MYNINLINSILNILRNNGISVPELSNDSAANAHYGVGLVLGKRYFNTTANKIMVYNGDEWIEQKTSCTSICQES